MNIDYEAGRKAVQGEVLAIDEIKAIIEAALGDHVLYEKGDTCRKQFVCTYQHAAIRGTMDVVHLVQTYPEVTE